jgi:hypothetical protein
VEDAPSLRGYALKTLPSTIKHPWAPTTAALHLIRITGTSGRSSTNRALLKLDIKYVLMTAGGRRRLDSERFLDS